MVVNYTNIEVCEDDGWRGICDRNFTEQDAQVICRKLVFSAMGMCACDVENLRKLIMKILYV